jgi:hypothetical protein
VLCFIKSIVNKARAKQLLFTALGFDDMIETYIRVGYEIEIRKKRPGSSALIESIIEKGEKLPVYF